jgi:hypothetical protein
MGMNYMAGVLILSLLYLQELRLAYNAPVQEGRFKTSGGLLVPSWQQDNLDTPPPQYSAAYWSAVASLTSLTKLCWQPHDHEPMPIGLAEAIGQLPALKTLTCKLMSVAAGQHLPASLRDLSVVVLCEPCEGVVQRCDLSRLTGLTSLHVTLHAEPTRVVVELDLAPEVRLVTLGLFEIPLWDHFGTMQLQSSLSVQHVEINLNTSGRLLDLLCKLVPEPLLRLQALGTLSVCGAGLTDIAAALSKMSSLTRLDLDWVTVAGEEVPWGASLAGLPLRHLQLGVSNGSPTDLLHLSRLTALTSLHLNVCTGLDDATAAGVVEPLTRLQGLSLKWDLQNLSIVVEPLPKLMQLSSLRLKCPYGVGLRAGDLHVLVPLTRLSSFEVPLKGDCTPAVVQEWLDGMPCLDSICSS